MRTQIRQSAIDFVYREARLADESRYDEWESLWSDEGVYWVPAEDGSQNPEVQLSIIYDNRARISSRVRQLKSGSHHTQIPVSQMRRLISNAEVSERSGLVGVASNFLLVEYRRAETNIWSGRTEHTLRVTDGDFEMVQKKVCLANGSGCIPTLSFLI
ncbi:aromatic-ring-hydroxylating dioxygenase subunit beta [Streptomyces sp. NPDC002659]|uniref:aromatic-ring-hydroxylating dioxygenase subunit beta n=1 Tax=Streptomyces sp. NPDC002659 TaxID=3364656 RepID=UPI00368401E4